MGEVIALRKFVGRCKGSLGWSQLGLGMVPAWQLPR